MWRRTFIFQSRLPRVCGADKSCELGMKKTRKTRRIADFGELGKKKARKTGRIIDFDTVEDSKGDCELGNKTRKMERITDFDESGKKKKARKTGRIANFDTVEDSNVDCELEKKKTRKRRWITDLDTINNKMRKMTAGEDENSDRISALPDPIIHHIFSFIRCTKDIVRTTLLSKNWKRVFDSYQSFDFDERRFLMREQRGYSGFEEYVEKSLTARLARLEGVHKLRLYAITVDMQCITSWIRAAIAKNLKELDVRVGTWEKYAWPLDLTHSNSITFLKITGSLYGLAAMKMCNLRLISFKDAEFLDMNLIKNLEENSPLLEDLRIVRCPYLGSLEISSLVKLKRVEVQECRGVRNIEIAAPNLETFWFHEKQKCVINLNCMENLRNVTLKDRTMSESALEECISKCPLLEKLELYRCNKIIKLTIRSQTLKSLALVQCAKLDQIDISEAPNLYSFQYNGSVMQFPLFNSPRLSEVKFSFKHHNERSNAKWDSLFSNFDGCRGFRLIIYTAQNMKIFDDPREADLAQTRACKIELTASSSKVVKNVDNWLRERHGKNLDVVSSDEELLNLIKTLIIDREDSPSCCRVQSNKCWRHYIEDVKVSASDTERKTSYSLTWRSRRKTEK